MAKITVKTILKIAEIISSIAVVIINILGGRKNDRTGSSKKK